MNELNEDSGFEQNSEDDIVLADPEIANLTPIHDLRSSDSQSVEKINPCLPLVKSGHSLEPDMLFG